MVQCDEPLSVQLLLCCIAKDREIPVVVLLAAQGRAQEAAPTPRDAWLVVFLGGYALAIAASSFLYIAVADLIPGLHQYWHPHLPVGRARGTARLGRTRAPCGTLRTRAELIPSRIAPGPRPTGTGVSRAAVSSRWSMRITERSARRRSIS